MTDRYWWGEVTRISPEAPVPILSVKRTEDRDGAAANVANNIRAMGVKCRENFGNQDWKIIKIRQIAKGQQMSRIDFDYQQNPITKLNLDGVKIVVFVDYGKGTLENVQDLIKQAKDSGCVVLVDPKGYDYGKYRGADVVKPNLDEMRVMVGGWRDEADLYAKADMVMRNADISAILLTRASEGMTLYTDEGIKHIPASAKELVDVSGAGEAAIAAMGVGIHRGYSLAESAVLANKAAGIAVSRFGTTVVREDEVF